MRSIMGNSVTGGDDSTTLAASGLSALHNGGSKAPRQPEGAHDVDLHDVIPLIWVTCTKKELNFSG
jgi:hypothetical protein